MRPQSSQARRSRLLSYQPPLDFIDNNIETVNYKYQSLLKMKKIKTKKKKKLMRSAKTLNSNKYRTEKEMDCKHWKCDRTGIILTVLSLFMVFAYIYFKLYAPYLGHKLALYSSSISI